MKRFYLSTALPYVNYTPHIGFALEIIQADVVARYHRMLGEEVFFLTGTDENSLKNVHSAKKEGISVQQLVDRNSKKFYQLKRILNLSFDDFIRTTEPRHIKGARKLWNSCKRDIYKKRYKGLYCIDCEQFYKKEELVNGLCPEHKTKPQLVEEENYFFRLSKYQGKLKKIIESDKIKILPQARKNEVLSFINSGLQDFCISRSASRAKGWGIPVPEDSSQIQWVWFDALSNYINALGYAKNSKKFQDFWQKNKNKTHIIGKGILRFHAIYWPAMLLSAGINLPNRIFVHGYLNVKGKKMSKSLGNVIDPFGLVEKYGTDPVRYFLLREIPSSEDGDFTYEKFEERYNADLAKGLGNLAARVITMAEKVQSSKLKVQSLTQSLKIKKEVKKTWKEYRKALDEFKFNEALISVWELISFCDKYIEREKPWKKSKNQLLTINNLLFVLVNIAQMLQLFLPQTSEKIFKQLGIKFNKRHWELVTFKNQKSLTSLKIKKSKPLFPRI